jgi:hypothetical protein
LGTYGNSTSLKRSSQCSTCPGGSYWGFLHLLNAHYSRSLLWLCWFAESFWLVCSWVLLQRGCFYGNSH